jgi:hypothetical protein
LNLTPHGWVIRHFAVPPTLHLKLTCAAYRGHQPTPTTAWCASKTNPLQKFVTHWEYSRADPKGFYLGGGLFEPIVADSTYGYDISNACDALCNSNALGTAYVVPVNQNNWGLAV